MCAGRRARPPRSRTKTRSVALSYSRLRQERIAHSVWYGDMIGAEHRRCSTGHSSAMNAGM